MKKSGSSLPDSPVLLFLLSVADEEVGGEETTDGEREEESEVDDHPRVDSLGPAEVDAKAVRVEEHGGDGADGHADDDAEDKGTVPGKEFRHQLGGEDEARNQGDSHQGIEGEDLRVVRPIGRGDGIDEGAEEADQHQEGRRRETGDDLAEAQEETDRDRHDIDPPGEVPEAFDVGGAGRAFLLQAIDQVIASIEVAE